jgi:hypothetical protein
MKNIVTKNIKEEERITIKLLWNIYLIISQRINDSVFDNKKDNKSYNLDSFDMIVKLDKSVDIIIYGSTISRYNE